MFGRTKTGVISTNIFSPACTVDYVIICHYGSVVRFLCTDLMVSGSNPSFAL